MIPNIWIGIVAVLVLVAGGGWDFDQPSTPATSDTAELPTTQSMQQNVNTKSKASSPQPSPVAANRTYVGAGFEVVIPSTWKVATARADGASQLVGYTTLSSPDYIPKSQAEIAQMGFEAETSNLVKQGAIIEVFPSGNDVSASVSDPAAYVQFRAEQRYSKQAANKKISLGGQAALLLQTRRDDNSLSTGVYTVRNGKEFIITLNSAIEASTDWTIWVRFLSSFKFNQSSASTISTPVVQTSPSTNPVPPVSTSGAASIVESCKQNNVAAIQNAVDQTTSKVKVRGCTVSKNIEYEGGFLNTILVSRHPNNANDDLLIPIQYVILPNGALQILSAVSSDNSVRELLKAKLDTSAWMGQGVKNSGYFLQNDSLCSRWSAQYPLQGSIQNCGGIASGDISYISNAMTWTDAKNIASKEFAKYTYGTYWNDWYNDYTNWTFKINSANSSSYYVFARSITFSSPDKGSLSNPIIVRVYFDGTSNSIDLQKNCGYVCRADVSQY